MIDAEGALEAITAMQDRLNIAHEHAKSDADIGHLGAFSANVPRYLLDYADRYAAAMGETRQGIIREALCLFYSIREIEPGRIAARSKARKRRVVVLRRGVRVRIPRKKNTVTYCKV